MISWKCLSGTRLRKVFHCKAGTPSLSTLQLCRIDAVPARPGLFGRPPAGSSTSATNSWHEQEQLFPGCPFLSQNFSSAGSTPGIYNFSSFYANKQAVREPATFRLYSVQSRAASHCSLFIGITVMRGFSFAESLYGVSVLLFRVKENTTLSDH